jgi:hypothetical protein
MSRIVIVILIYHRHKPIDIMDIISLKVQESQTFDTKACLQTPEDVTGPLL